MKAESNPFTRLVTQLTVLPVVIVFAYFDSRSDGSIGFAIIDFFAFLGQAFLFLLAIVSLAFAGVSASGRMKSGPDTTRTEEETPPNIGVGTFLAALTYIILFGWLYFSGAAIGGFSLANYSPLTNALLFAMPIWTVVCVARYKSEMQSSNSKGEQE